MEDATGPEPFLRDDESLAAAAEEMVARHAHVGQPDLAVVPAGVPHGGCAPSRFAAMRGCPKGGLPSQHLSCRAERAALLDRLFTLFRERNS